MRANHSHNIDGLNPDTNYTVSIVVISNVGLGHPAYNLTLTLEEGMYTYLMCLINHNLILNKQMYYCFVDLCVLYKNIIIFYDSVNSHGKQ